VQGARAKIGNFHPPPREWIESSSYGLARLLRSSKDLCL